MRPYAESVFMKKWITSLVSFWSVALTFCFAQNIPIDTWRTHFSYNNARILEEGNGKIFCAVENGLFYIDLATGAINTLSKTDGLSDAGITSLSYSEDFKTLVIGYESGLVDLHHDGKVTTIRDIKNATLVGSKKIHQIITHGQLAYVGTSFGIIVVSLERREIVDNHRSFGPNATDVTVTEMLVFGERLFTLTNAGLLSASLQSNLSTYTSWILEADSARFSHLTATSENVFVIKNDTLIAQRVGNQWIDASWASDESIIDMKADHEFLYLLTSSNIHQYQSTGPTALKSIAPLQANTFLPSDGFWIGDLRSGLIDPAGQSITPNGPLSDHITQIRYTDQHCYAFYGPHPEDYYGQTDSLGYSLFDNTSWGTETIEGFYNITDVAFFENNHYFSSTGYGLYNQTEGSLVTGLSKNLEGYDPLIPQLTTSSDLLYIPSYESGEPLYTLDEAGQLNPYSLSFIGTSFPLAVSLSQRGVLWITRGINDGGGFIALNLNNQDFRELTTADKIPSNQINGVAIDLSDETWIATVGGPAIFTEASFIFDDINAIIPIYDNKEVFEDESVTAVAVDGGNRIWMSTREGLWIFDNSLSQLEAHFTSDNSPLPSNMVLKMAYNSKNGEMFILTEKGLVSYRSGSSAGGITNRSVSVFPNPVRPGYEGMVGITGLVRDASVKITDVNGKLIREVAAKGGTASWDLLDYNGQRVRSGIYILFNASQDGSETHIGKIAVIN